MRDGTAYAAKLKKAWAKHRSGATKPVIPELQDPVHCLARAMLGDTLGDNKAGAAIDRLMSQMVDWNEVRVSSAFEIQEAMDSAIPEGIERCQRLKHALQAIFDCENRLGLDRLRSIGRREARQILEQLRGVDEYVVASVVLWGLGGHAIPVNARLLKTLREAGLVHPSASRAEVQAFLERHISATDARAFCLTMRSFTPSKGTARRSGKSTKARKTRKAAT